MLKARKEKAAGFGLRFEIHFLYVYLRCYFNINKMKTALVIDNIKDSILKFVPARYIYLFGSYVYGNPTEKSDIDVYVVTPDEVSNFSELYTKVICDLSDKDIFFIDLLFATESSFNTRRTNRKFEKTIHQKGRILYEQ